MLLRNPQPDPDFSRRFNEPTMEFPAIPKQPTMEFLAIPKQRTVPGGYAKTPKQQEWMPPQQQTWTPPPYWRDLLHTEETKFERKCKEWFLKALLVLGSLGSLALISIYLFKLIVMVAMQ